MAGQLTQYGAQFMGNKIGGNCVPFIGASAPSTWIPGQEWINGSTINVYDPHTSAWVTGPYNLYMALLTGTPLTAGPGGTLAVNISDIAPIEDTTPGYMRQPVSFNPAAAASPSSIFNANLAEYGPYTANQAAPIVWTALLAIPAAFSTTGSPVASTVLNGLLLYVWQVPNPQQVLATQNVAIAADTFDIGVS
jgi:hypothetical protein